ncbi:MAG: sialidase, partial [Haloarculaceae archaeon]
MYSRVALAAVIILAAVPGGVAGAVAGEPVLSASLADGTVTPGETTSLRMTVINTGNVEGATPGAGDLARRVTTARGLTVDVQPGEAPISVLTGERAVGTLPEGATPPLEIPIAVAEDATPGTYSLPVELTYTYTERITDRGNYVETTVTETVSVTLEVTDGASFEVTDVDASVRVGSSGTVAVSIENAGTAPATDASVSLSSRNADLTLGRSSSASRYVGEWAAGESRTVSYEVSAAGTAASEPYTMAATVAYEDDDGVPAATDALTFALTPQGEQRFPVLDAESNVSVGDSGSVSLTMHNQGPVAVRDTTVTLTSTSGALAFGRAATATRFVGSWAPGENRTVTFDVTATEEAETRSYVLRASVAYEDLDGDPGQAPTSAVGVRPAPRQDFAFTAGESDLEVGADGTLEGTVTNTGDGVARNLVVAFAEQPTTVTPLEGEAPVGDLEPGESADFSFPVT